MATHLETDAPGGPEVKAPWKLVRRGGSAKVAFSLKELVGLTSEFSVKKAPNCTSKVIRTDAGKFLLVYRVTCGESYSDPKGHVVRLKFDFKRLKETGSVDDLDVRVSCSCPAFLYWGPQWNVSTGDALYGAPRPLLKAPTDPERYKFVVCKHVKVVADRIQPVLDRMLAKYQTERDEATEAEKQKQLDVAKEQTEQEAERAQVDKAKDRAQKETDAELQKMKQRKPILPKDKGGEDLDAMPDDLTTLGLPAKRPPITPKVKPEEPPKPSNVTLVDDEDMGSTEIPAGKKHRPMNVRVVEDDDDTTVVLPGAKRRRMDIDLGILPVSEAVEERGRKAPKVWADEALDVPEAVAAPAPSPRPPLPPHLQQVEDDADDQVTKINRLKARMAALILAQGA